MHRLCAQEKSDFSLKPGEDFFRLIKEQRKATDHWQFLERKGFIKGYYRYDFGIVVNITARHVSEDFQLLFHRIPRWVQAKRVRALPSAGDAWKLDHVDVRLNRQINSVLSVGCLGESPNNVFVGGRSIAAWVWLTLKKERMEFWGNFGFLQATFQISQTLCPREVNSVDFPGSNRSDGTMKRLVKRVFNMDQRFGDGSDDTPRHFVEKLKLLDVLSCIRIDINKEAVCSSFKECSAFGIKFRDAFPTPLESFVW